MYDANTKFLSDNLLLKSRFVTSLFMIRKSYRKIIFYQNVCRHGYLKKYNTWGNNTKNTKKENNEKTNKKTTSLT